MKSLFNLFLLIVSVWCFSSCSDSFLGETTTTDLDRETVFADSVYTAGFLTQIYADIGFDTDPNRYKTVYLGFVTEHGGIQTACDEAEFKKSSKITTDVLFATGTVNPVTVLDDTWKKCYENIRRVNIFLKYSDGSAMATGAKTTYKAEARFLRAWYYAILLRHHGGVPLIGDNVYEATDEMKTSRDTYADCVDYIIGECALAEKDLPKNRTGRQNGRISAGACKALVSRVRLYAASKLYNGSDFAPADFPKELLGYPEYDEERWKLAADAALDVIAMNQYKLYNRHKDEKNIIEPGWGFYAIFESKDFYKQTDGENGITYPSGSYCGTILEKKVGGGNGREGLFSPPTCGGNGNGGYVYHDLVEAFPMKDGKPVNESDKYTYDPLNPNIGRDPRLANSVIYDGCKLNSKGDNGHVVTIYKGKDGTSDAIYAGTPTGYYVRKTLHRGVAANHWAMGPQSRPLMRYAEILLNYAEATNKYYGPDHEDMLGEKVMSPYEALKLIRERAGIEAGDDGMYGLQKDMTPEEMETAIRLERRIELAFEGHRFFDVRRWMITDQTDNVMMHGFEITKNEDGTKTGKVINVRQHVFRKAMYFTPIPYKETVKSEDLLQNPYYE